MASSERKRQEKLLRNAAKRKQRMREIRRSQATSSRQGMSAAEQMALLDRRGNLAEFAEIMQRYQDSEEVLSNVDAPIHACLVPARLFQDGIGPVVVSRKLPDGNIVAAFFLLDVWCLGVKNAFFRVASASAYPTMLRDLSQHQRLNPIDPACARKLIEGAEEYAADLGFSPHPDYEVCRRIFGDIDKNGCRTQFRFGKDGKPFYASGPYDTQAKSKKIVDTLMQRCGPDGFHYMVMLDGAETVADWAGGEEADEGEVVEGEVVEEDQSPEEEESKGASSWLRRLPPFRR